MISTRMFKLIACCLAILWLEQTGLARGSSRGGGFSSRSRSSGFSSRSSYGSSKSTGSTRSTWGSSSKDGYTRKGGVFGQSSRGQGFSNSKSRTRTNFTRSAGIGSQSERAHAYSKNYSQPVTVINHNYHGYPGSWGSWGWGYGRIGVWDLFFLSTVNHLFWYHHWNDPSIHKALYQDNILQKEELAKLEAKVAELEKNNIPRDPNYLPKDVDPDIAYSKEYVDNNPDKFYQKESASGGFTSLMVLCFVGFLFYFLFIRKY